MLGVEAEAEFHFSAVVGHCKPVLSILFIYLFLYIHFLNIYFIYFLHKTLSHCKPILCILQTICVTQLIVTSVIATVIIGHIIYEAMSMSMRVSPYGLVGEGKPENAA